MLGNCKRTLSLLTELIQPQKHEEWIASFKPYEEKEFNQVIEKEVFPKEGPINMGEVVNAVSEATHNEAILVTDVGQNQMMACRYFKFTKPRSIVTSVVWEPWVSVFRLPLVRHSVVGPYGVCLYG